MRKGQLHPTVVMSAVKSLLSSTSAGIGPQDVFVQVCGGTPEGCIAAIMVGFQHVIYVGSPEELMLMKLPSEAEETMLKMNYGEYSSSNVEFPEQGVLAAEAVKMLAPYVRNYIFDTANTVQIQPPFPIHIPPLRTYTFIAVTGRVVARTIMPDGSAGSSEGTKSKSKSEQPNSQSEQSEQSKSSDKCGGPGSASGPASVATPQKKGKRTADDDGKDGNEEEEVDEDQEEEPADDDDLAALEAMEMEESGGGPNESGKKRGRPKKGAKPTPKKKPKAKA